jgi:hypothetical protein
VEQEGTKQIEIWTKGKREIGNSTLNFLINIYKYIVQMSSLIEEMNQFGL